MHIILINHMIKKCQQTFTNVSSIIYDLEKRIYEMSRHNIILVNRKL